MEHISWILLLPGFFLGLYIYIYVCVCVCVCVCVWERERGRERVCVCVCVCMYVCINKIFYQITYKSWYAIEPNQPTIFSSISFLQSFDSIALFEYSLQVFDLSLSLLLFFPNATLTFGLFLTSLIHSPASPSFFLRSKAWLCRSFNILTDIQRDISRLCTVKWNLIEKYLSTLRQRYLLAWIWMNWWLRGIDKSRRRKRRSRRRRRTGRRKNKKKREEEEEEEGEEEGRGGRKRRMMMRKEKKKEEEEEKEEYEGEGRGRGRIRRRNHLNVAQENY